MSLDLDRRRDELVALRTRLRTVVEDMAAGEDTGEINTAAGDQHLADHASAMLDREVDATLEENAEEIVREIDAGTYGSCAVCGKAIPEGRLDAIPYATLCVEDKRAAERA